MIKTLVFWVIFLFFFSIPAAFCLEVTVDIKGPQDLTAMKEGIAKTITARCLAKDIKTEADSSLNVSIIQLGDTLSFDAILETKPPRAFHRDLKGTGELSPAIDQMIGEIFAAPPMKPSAGTGPIFQEPSRDASPEVKLPFTATSIAVLKDVIFVSSEDAVYRIDGGKAKTYWTPPASSRIYRLYSHQEMLLAVTVSSNSFASYLIKDGRTIKTWKSCVVPLKDGLIASRIFTDQDLPDGINRWSKPEAVEGNPGQVPEGSDILSMLVSDVSPLAEGDEIVTIDKSDKLTVLNGKTTLWTSDTKLGTLPYYLITKEKGPQARKEAQIRYYLGPRIVMQGKDIITIGNVEGMTKIFGNVKMYDSSRILAYTRDESEFNERELATIRNYYCSDIALDKGQVLALVVKKSASYIQRIDL